MIEIFILKLFVAVSVVVGLSIIAEHSSPRIAGLLSGYPTGSAISLFFFGLEIDPQFAADSALYNMIGLLAAQVFIYAYYKISSKYGIMFSSIVAIISYFAAISLLSFLELNRLIAVIVPTASIVLFLWLFRSIGNTVVENRPVLNLKIVFLRGLFAAAIILLITGVAKLVGPRWSGLFSAFPTTLFPLILIIHFTYDRKHVHTIIKNVPAGLLSLILYSLSVSLTYPKYGIYWGTVISFAVATLYLIFRQVKNLSKILPCGQIVSV